VGCIISASLDTDHVDGVNVHKKSRVVACSVVFGSTILKLGTKSFRGVSRVQVFPFSRVMFCSDRMTRVVPRKSLELDAMAKWVWYIS
jgi:hypothetical protein